MIKKNVVLILFLFISGPLFAQTAQITGRVLDSLSNPFSYATIIAKPQSENVSLAFAITDEKGRFKIELKENETYVITVSYLGFKPTTFKVTLTENIIKDIQLQPAINQLDEVVVTQKIPVKVKEDTITYNIEVFTTGTERKLKQVLKKLPGVEVDNNGSVTVMGKKVNKLLVDGKTFFNGGTKLGVENIPADAVDAVEVIDNYNEVAFLKGLNDSDKMAMNIKLKKDKKKFTFGDVENGIGNNNHYLVHPNLFYYSPKTTFNFIGDLNDVGVKSFTIKDYMDFEGGIGKLLSDPSSYFQLSNNDFAKFLTNQDFKKGQNKFGAINIRQVIISKMDLSGYAIYSNTKTLTEATTINQYQSEEEQTIENKLTKGDDKDRFFMSKLMLDYAPNSKEDISYSGFIKSAVSDDRSNLETAFDISTNNLKTNTNTNAVTVKQNAEWHKELSRGHTFSFTVNYHYDRNTPTSNWLSDNPILQGLIPLANDTTYTINQVKKLQLNNIDLFFKHYWVLNKSNHIYTTIGNNHLKENYFTNDYQLLSNGNINNFNNGGFGNDLNLTVNDFYVGVQHKFKTGIVTTKYGIAAHNYQWNNKQESSYRKSKWVLLPDFLMKIDFSKSEHLNFRYNLKSLLADAPKYANRLRLNSYNTVTKGNDSLDHELYHSLRAWYTKFSLYKGIVMNANISFNKKIKGIQYRSQLQGINQFTEPYLINNPETNWALSTSIKKKIRKLTAKISGSLNFSNYFQTVNQQTFKNKSNTQSLGIEFGTNFKKWPNVEIGYKKDFSKYFSAYNTSDFSNENPYFNIDYDFLNGFIFSADYSRNNYKDDFGHVNRYEMANTSLFYQKEDSAWGFKISGSNILGVTYKNQNSFSDYIISDTKIYIMPRIWLFTVSYKI